MKKLIALFLSMLLVLSFSGCGSSSSVETEPAEPVNLAELYEGFSATLPSMFLADADTMMNFMGICTEDCTQAVVALCADGLRTDEVWLLEAKSEDALTKLKQLAENRIQAKADETVSYSPDQYKVVEKAELLVHDLYLALLISPDVDALKAEFEAAIQ